MANLTYTKFKEGPVINSNDKRDRFLYRKEINSGNNIVFAISGTTLSILETTEESINFDTRSDKIIRGTQKFDF